MEKQEWKTKASAFLRKLTAGGQGEGTKIGTRPKVERVASWNALLGLHWQLSMFGIPLTKFLPSADDPVDISERFHLAINWDTGPDMNCIANFLLFGRKARISSFPDPLHRANRVLANSASDAGMSMAIQVICIVLNLEHGPFSSQAWWAEERDAAKEACCMMDEDDILLGWLAPKIAQDRLQQNDASGHSVLAELRQGDFLATKLARAAPTRWGTLHRGLSRLADDWHLKLLVCLALGLSQGWLHKDSSKASVILDKLRVRAPPQDSGDVGTKPSVSMSMTSAAKMRDQCKGTMHLVTSALCDETFRFDALMVDFVGRPIEAWQMSLDKRLRSAPEGLRWYTEIANGEGGMERALETLLHPWRRLGELHRMGFLVNISDMVVAECNPDSDVFAHQQAMYERLCKYVMHTVKHLILSFAHLFVGYPGRFALLHHSSEEVRGRAWNQMRVDWEAWNRVRNNGNTHWKKCCERSMYTTTVVREIFEEAERMEWQRTPTIDKATRRLFEHFATSLPSEIAFQQLTDAKRDQRAGGMAPHSLWRKPVGRGVLSKVFKFSEVDSEETKLAITKANRIPESCFHPVVKHMEERFDDLPGRGRPAWPSFSPAMSMAQVAEQRMTTSMHLDNTVDMASKSWQTCFLHLGLCVIDKHGQWFMVVANTQTTAVLWPLRRFKVGTAVCIALCPWSVEGLKWLPCLSLAEWSVVPTQVVSPMYMIYLHKHREPEHWQECIASVAGKQETLVAFAAKQGFWSLPLPPLKKLHQTAYADAFEWDATSVGHNLLRLIKAVLKCSESDAAAYLSHRLRHVDDSSGCSYSHMLDTSEAFAAMTTSEQKDCDKVIEEQRAKQLHAKQLRETVRETIQKHATRKKGPRPAVKTQMPSDDNEWSEEFVQTLLPPVGARLRRSLKDGRWRGHWKFDPTARGQSTMSRAWGSRSHRECVTEILQAIWADAEMFGYECHVVGLLPS